MRMSDFPEDFQQILSDILWQGGVEHPEDIEFSSNTVELGLFRDQLHEDMDYWDKRDIEVVSGMISSILNHPGQLPPVLHYDGGLKDGYHRTAAHLLCGHKFIRAINIANYVKELV